uniref:Acetyl-CoA synthetase n=1 Tax=Marinobacter nauticus TaxID=2743 RepID=A0A455W554_MARNT|nr:acetyl-CoA synthetase [Marinobacter nauticus]
MSILSEEHRLILTQTTNLAFDQHRPEGCILIPHYANLSADTVGRFARPGTEEKEALRYERNDGSVRRYTFADLETQSNRIAAQLRHHGVKKGDRVAIHTGFRPETALGHLACHKLGAIVVTLSHLYGPRMIEHVLTDSGASVLITEDNVWRGLRGQLTVPDSLRMTVVSGSVDREVMSFESLNQPLPGNFEPERTLADDPALLMYTSGSTGMPKGMLHAHRILHAYSPTISMFYNLELETRDCVCWTPADWAWVGGLLDLLLPAWKHGHTVISSAHRFDGRWALEFMVRHGVTHTFMPPTALKRIAELDPESVPEGLVLRVICTGGEPLPGETLKWLEKHLGVVCNEFYGLTEVNHLVGNCQALYTAREGSMGRAYPGHSTSIIDAQGQPVPVGEVGEIAAREDDPTRFLGYWRQSEKTQALVDGIWMRTGDLARQDEDGYFWYQGRSDDLILTAGHRVGPAEVEDTLLSHHSVAEAAVIPRPDPERGQIVVALVRLREGVEASEALKKQLQHWVKKELAAYKYPRDVRFVAEFPLTSSGKISRKQLAAEEKAAYERSFYG